MKAIDIIRNEHRAVAAVLQALQAVVDGIRIHGRAPDFQMLAALVEYICEVPEKLHHPKEDQVLFAHLRQRGGAMAPLLDRLQAQHLEGAAMIRDLQGALIRYVARGPEAFGGFDAQVRQYADFQWEHMRTEERELLPQARQSLTEADWADIDAAFEANREPWSGPAGDFRSLLSHIVNLVPPPHGLGPASDPAPSIGRRDGA
jgi:branched-chain amino acid transport system ATP-binding protein